MENFLIPPDYCVILRALKVSGSLRSAGALLNSDPATLVRKFQVLASDYELIMKTGRRWVITEKGERVLSWLEESMARQKLMLDEKPCLRVASFSWLAEQKLIPHFSELNQLTRHKYHWVFKTLAADLEQELINGRSDYVITGHAPTDPLIAFKRIVSHDWKVIIPQSWKPEVSRLSEGALIQYLQRRPFLRLGPLNPVEVLKFEVGQIHELQVDGVIGIRSAVVSGLGWSCVPAMSVQSFIDRREVHALKLPTLTTDTVSVWWLRSRKDIAAHSKAVVSWVTSFS